ncbi:diacylglycerol/lipid kinase family protein [Nocardia sp. NPDC004068]|uniref:diacylglycerol/lipid kinase family protein n=1 Tax=Nocardia sp. NPDC004068 TaxID=3364303 RepID=UPI0036798245
MAAITNALAGGNPADIVAVLREQDDVELDVSVTRSAGDAEILAREIAATAAADIIVAIGGDGTAGEVARGMYGAAPSSADTRPALLIAPGGTGNSNYRCLWDDEPWPRVVRDVFVTGEHLRKHLDLALITSLGTPALLGISAGLLPEALTISHTLRSDGREKLAEAALLALQSYRAYPGRVVVDGELLAETDILAVLIGGSRYRGGFLELLPRSVLDDGLLDVCVVSAAMSREEFATSCLNGTLDTAAGSSYRTGKTVRIERTDGHPLTIDHDGELAAGDAASVEVAVLPSAIDVLASARTRIWSEQRIEAIG